jgi:hypothetical protein
MSRTGWVVLGLILLLGGGGAFWFLKPPASPPNPGPETDDGPETAIRFEDVTKKAGIDFVHFDSSTDMHYIHETMGSGVAWIDYNKDGYLDLLLLQDGPVKPGSFSGALPTPKLYRNNGDGTFTDVTRQVGLDHPGFGMGAAVGDYDNDGYDDLFVTYFGEVRLYHNEPDGQGGRRFVDVTEKAGLKNPHWGTSCGWGDIDGDGFLDLYVCNYVEVDLANYQECFHEKAKQRYLCPPRVFPAGKHKLFRNKGNGTFEDFTEASGIAAAPASPGLAVALVDLDGDGKLDIYAANDMMPAYLFHNQGGGKFVEKGVLAGCALQSGGRYLAGMCVAVGDVDSSGRPSLFVTNYQKEPNNLFLNLGKMVFHDGTQSSRLGPPSVPYLAFGAVLFDANLDGILDVAVANGHVLRNAEAIENAPYRQNPQFFEGLGRGTFAEVTRRVGPTFREKLVGRGLAWCDYDNDGRPDLILTQNGGPPILLRNVTQTDNRWIRLELIGDGKRSNTNAIGAVVEVETAGKKQTHWIIGGGSYLSASDRRLLIGLASADTVDRVTVTWPSGDKQEFRNLASRKWFRLREGVATPETVAVQK